MLQESKPVVIDAGSGISKAGFAADDVPCTVFPSVVAPHFVTIPLGTYVGYAAQRCTGSLSLEHPIKHGIITNWEQMERIWRYIFSGALHVSPDEHPVLLTEAALNHKYSREKMTADMFETFSVPALYVQSSQVLSLYATGHTTGIVLNSGEDVTSSVPIYEGYHLPHAICSLDIGGRNLSDYIMSILRQHGYPIRTEDECKIVTTIKETLCYVSLDFEKEMQKVVSSSTIKKSYTMPDGCPVVFKEALFSCPEILFQPHLFYSSEPGIHRKILESIRSCDRDIREDLCRNIVLSGGSTLFEGLPERLSKELTALTPYTPHVSAPPLRQFLAWIGGSIFASLSTFQEMSITRAEYDEFGPIIVQRKCI